MQMSINYDWFHKYSWTSSSISVKPGAIAGYLNSSHETMTQRLALDLMMFAGTFLA